MHTYIFYVIEESLQREVQSNNATRWFPKQFILLTLALLCSRYETIRAGFLNTFCTSQNHSQKQNLSDSNFLPILKTDLRWTDNQKTSFETIVLSLIRFHKLTIHWTLADTLHSACLYSYHLNLMVYNPWGFVHVSLTQCLSTVSAIGIGVWNYSQPPVNWPQNCYAFWFNSSHT